MDVIAVQAANKVLKKMNTEFAGIYDKSLATIGQTTFKTSKVVDSVGHTLKVFVDGILAIKGEDYTQPNSTTVEFVKAFEEELEVLLTTDVVGLPRVEIVYDDTQVKADISSLNTRQGNNTSAINALQSKTIGQDIAIAANQQTHNDDVAAINTEIANIKAALDADNDGSIIDTIADIKTQWENADNDIKGLVNNKADNSIVVSLSSKVDGIETAVETHGSLLTAHSEAIALIQDELSDATQGHTSLREEIQSVIDSIPAAYNDTAMKIDVVKAQEDADTANSSITVLTESLNTVKAEILAARDGEVTLIDKLNAIEAAIPTIPAPYDDTIVVGDIIALSERIDNLPAPTPEYDDTIVKGDITALLERIDAIELPVSYDDTEVKGDIAALGERIDNLPVAYDDTALAGRVTALEDKKLDAFLIEDTAVPGDMYKITITNGVLSAEKVV